jgi:TPR repeat protein
MCLVLQDLCPTDGHNGARHLFGLCLKEGIAVAKHEMLQYKFVKASAAADNPGGQNALCLSFENRRRTMKNLRAIVEQWKLSTEQGNCLLNYERALSNGICVETEPAEYNYAMYLEKRKAVAQDHALAAKFFKKARSGPLAAAKEGLERWLRERQKAGIGS